MYTLRRALRLRAVTRFNFEFCKIEEDNYAICQLTFVTFAKKSSKHTANDNEHNDEENNNDYDNNYDLDS